MYGNEGTRFGDGIDLNRVLTELHGKRKWLDELIQGLEAVAQSPEVALVTAVEEVLSGDWCPKPKVDLGSRKKARLLRLASRVKNRTHGDRASQTTQHNISA
jgi:hypothetical protein